ncbi:UNVERIFIED_CONTAM: DNA-(apurinic or apyrimidinic site) lyase [Siphonaria sp. JEL0065]|nr:DNA-(apurinic or apyrimidinic site) lyase [Siphonaria sp. JEL0065]
MGPKRKAKAVQPISDNDNSDSESSVAPAPKARKVKASTPNKKQKIAAFVASTDDESPVADLEQRMNKSNKWVGPHASAAGGPMKAVGYTARVGGQSFAMFLSSQRKWDRAPLTSEQIAAFKKECEEKRFNKSHIMPHGSYLINLGNPDKDKRAKGLEAFLEDVSRCDRLGIELYNFHPGSTVGECTPERSIALIAEGINQAIETTPNVIIVIENMAGQGNTIGRTFEQLHQIIALVHDKTRVGVCLDTCHMFASGYDIRTAVKFDAIMKDFDRIVGLKFLKAMHLNDSMTDLSSGKDRHDHIGNGKIGLEAFRFIMNDDRFNGIPMVLEVPVDPKTEIAIYSREIKLLYSLVEDKKVEFTLEKEESKEEDSSH